MARGTLKTTAFLTAATALLPALVLAEDAPPLTLEAVQGHVEAVQTNANFVWTLICAFLVFFMQAGFALVETGFTRAKNTVNILMKNLLDFCFGSLAYFAFGFALMFGPTIGGWVGSSGFFLSDYGTDNDPWIYAFWLFQIVFAATAATIVSGAVAERIKFSAYLIYSIVISALVYPVYGHWAWGGLYKAATNGAGWLFNMGFIDFAGSSVVHSIGGWAALAGAMVLGPRIGKFDKEGRARPIPGHNMTNAALGVFILWFGWFGFNPGSTTAAITDIAKIAVNTNLAAAAGCICAMLAAWHKLGKPDLGMALNGALAGLVAITSPCNNVSPMSAIAIGAIAGVLVFYSVLFFDKIRIDDPVGAISVHGVCGAFGTLAAAIFNQAGFTVGQLGVQALGVACAFVWSFGICFVLFSILKAAKALRVSEEEEIEGLDLGEHGNEAYPNFVVRALQ